jgi:glycerate 2-kinase
VTAGQADLEGPPRAAPALSEAIIGNSHELVDHGLTELRQVVLDVAEAGLRAANPGHAVERLVRYDGRLLHAAERGFDLAAARSVVVLGAGKASVAIAAAVEEMLGDAITGGLIVTRHGSRHPLRRIEVITADHPVPSTASWEAGRRLAEIASGLGPGVLLITVFTGGSSALACLPPDGVTFAAKQRLHTWLLGSGASIADINAVRKHVSAIKGGRLAALAAGATILNLTVSDVVGDHVDLLCDPAVQDTTTSAGAITVLERLGLWAEMPAEVRDHLQGEASESPSLSGRDITTSVLLTGADILPRMAQEASALGWRPALLGSRLDGEAASLGGFLGTLAAESSEFGTPFSPGTVLIAAGGEATVTLRHPGAGGHGRGGPNQEMALAFARSAGRGDAAVAGVFLDSDGSDGGTAAAGGCVDSTTARRAAGHSMYLDDVIARHDATAALSDLGDLVRTGPTGTNVSDIWVMAIAAADGRAGAPG